MTAPARITQHDMERATKAVAAAGFARAQIVMDLASQKIVIIIGESPAAPAVEAPEADREAWSDEDV